MKKKLLLVVMSLLSIVFCSNATKTVYFQNTGNWSEVAAYCWSKVNGTDVKYPEGQDWPGVVFSTTISVPDYGILYEYKVDDSVQNIIFNNNNNGQQTVDLAAVDGNLYSYEKNKKVDNAGNAESIANISDLINDMPTVRVYFKNTNSWDKVYCYLFNNDSNNSWPGVNITESKTNINGEDLYYCDFKKGYTQVIFNNGSDSYKTNDLNILQNAVYNTSVDKHMASNFIVQGDKIVNYTEQKRTVYFKKPSDWTKVNCYFWSSTLGGSYATWPGISMSAVTRSGEELYSTEIPSIFDQVIFNNGQGGTGNHTEDLKVLEDGVYTEDMAANSVPNQVMKDGVEVNASPLAIYYNGTAVAEPGISGVNASALGAGSSFTFNIARGNGETLDESDASKYTVTLTPGSWKDNFLNWTNENVYAKNAPIVGTISLSQDQTYFEVPVTVYVGGDYTINVQFAGDNTYVAESLSCGLTVKPTVLSLGLSFNYGVEVKEDNGGLQAVVNKQDGQESYTDGQLGSSPKHCRIVSRADMPTSSYSLYYKVYYDGTVVSNLNSRASEESLEDYTKFSGGVGANLENAKSISIIPVQNGVQGDRADIQLIQSEETSVDAVEMVGEGEARYFNLQGVEVVNPSAGLYIRILNGKAEKVIIK